LDKKEEDLNNQKKLLDNGGKNISTIKKNGLYVRRSIRSKSRNYANSLKNV
jgi:hypothetical protein